MKTDNEVQSDVIAELAWDPSVQAQGIGVAVKDGIVTLTGSVLTFSEKLSAEAAVRRISGVRGIAEELEVNLLGPHIRNDGDISRAIANGLDWNAKIPKGTVTCLVEGGGAVLNGTVDWNYQREAAYRSVEHVMGVRSVSNQILVRVQPADAALIKDKVTAALKRLALKDAAGIRIQASNGKVVVEGNVHSWAELAQASSTIWSAPGVTNVENNLVVVG